MCVCVCGGVHKELSSSIGQVVVSTRERVRDEPQTRDNFLRKRRQKTETNQTRLDRTGLDIKEQSQGGNRVDPPW